MSIILFQFIQFFNYGTRLCGIKRTRKYVYLISCVLFVDVHYYKKYISIIFEVVILINVRFNIKSRIAYQSVFLLLVIIKREVIQLVKVEELRECHIKRNRNLMEVDDAGALPTLIEDVVN